MILLQLLLLRLLEIMLLVLLMAVLIRTESTLRAFPKRPSLIIRMRDVLYQYQGADY
jgi:hypothetical protein